jgi:O-antigen/teichoic acid export membrane protein
MAIPQMTSYLNMGLLDALAYIVPTGKTGKIDSIPPDAKEKIINYVLSVTILFTAGMFLYTLLSWNNSSLVTRYAALAAVFTVTIQIVRIYVAHLSAETRFLKLSWLEFAYALALLIFSAVFMHFLGGYGFWLAFILSSGALAVYGIYDYTRRNTIRIKIFRIAEFNRLIPLGIVMTLSGAIYSPFLIVSKLFIAFTLGAKAVGFFVLAILTISALSMIPKVTSRVMMPHISEIAGDGNGFKDIFELYAKTQKITLVLTAATIVAGMAALPVFTTKFLPQYIPGIPAARIILLAALPYSFLDNANNLLIVTHNKRLYLKLFSAAFSLNILLFAPLPLMKTFSVTHVSAVIATVFGVYAGLLYAAVKKIHATRQGTDFAQESA